MRVRLALSVGGVAVALVAAGTAGAYAAPTDDPTPAIIGGHEVSSAPWGAQLGGGCSGSIIGSRWVLSAWHCISDDPGNPGSVRIGDVKRGQGQLANITKVHHKYDVLLAELDRDVNTTYAKIADQDPPVGAPTDIYGWGLTCEDGCSQSDVLKTARMRVKNVDSDDDGARMISLEQAGDGFAWFGDSGGPAFWNGVQVGVLCCGNTSSDGSGTEAYSSLNNVKAWIEQISGIKPGGGTSTPPSPNLALNRATTSSAPCVSSEASAKAVNGSVSGGLADKWCSATGTTKQLQVDLGASKSIQQVVVKHAGSGGESAAMNTKSFQIQASAGGGGAWRTIATVTNNTASVTTHTASGSARLIRLLTTDPIARIYELEVH